MQFYVGSDETSELITALGPVLALAEKVDVAVYPQRMVLLLPTELCPDLTQFFGYEVIHVAVAEPMLGVPGYRPGPGVRS